MSWNLFLDDERKLPRCLEDRNFTIARTAKEAIRLVSEKGLPTEMWLDHDLGIPNQDAPLFMHWLINTVLDTNSLAKAARLKVRIHSHNAIGAENMKRLWEQFTGTEVPYTPYWPEMPYQEL